MLNIEYLIDTIQQILNPNASHETACFSTLDLKYAYSQTKLTKLLVNATLKELVAKVRHISFHYWIFRVIRHAGSLSESNGLHPR